MKIKYDDLVRILKEEKPNLNNNYHVEKIGIFGSYARNEQTSHSDVDLLVEFKGPIGFGFMDLKDYLETLLNRPVDLVTKNALKPLMRDEILKEVRYL